MIYKTVIMNELNARKLDFNIFPIFFPLEIVALAWPPLYVQINCVDSDSKNIM